MAGLKDEAHTPIAAHKAVYDQNNAEYEHLHDYFGRGENGAVKRLKALNGRVQGGI